MQSKEACHNFLLFHSLKDACNVGDEGGFAPGIQDNKEGLDLLIQAIENAGYTGKIKIAMDAAASEVHI